MRWTGHVAYIQERGKAYAGFWWGSLRKEATWKTQAQMGGCYEDEYSESGMWGNGLDQAGSGQGQVAGTFECDNEPSGSVKCGAFLDSLQTSQAPKKDSAPWSK